MRNTARPATSSTATRRCRRACRAPAAARERTGAARIRGARWPSRVARRVVEREIERARDSRVRCRAAPRGRRASVGKRATHRVARAPARHRGSASSARRRCTSTRAPAMRVHERRATPCIAVHDDAHRRRLAHRVSPAAAACRIGRVVVEAAARSCGRRSRPRPAPAAAPTARSADRGNSASHTLCVTAKLTSWPIRSISSNAPIRKPPASRSTASIVAASAAPSASRRNASP